MGILVEKLGPGVKNIQRAGCSRQIYSNVCITRGGTCVVLRDAHIDASAIELDFEAWNGMGWRGYLYMSCGRESQVGEISHFLTFPELHFGCN